MGVNSRLFPFAALLLGACFIGLAPIFVRLTETGPAAAGFWRMAMALPMLAPFALRRPADGGAAPPSRVMLAAGVFFALDLSFWHYGITLTSVVNATVLANMTPIFVTIAAWLLLSERPSRGFVVGLMLAIAGALTMAAAHGGGAVPGRNPPLGDALSLVTSLWYAGYFLCVRKARKTRSTTAVMFWSSLVAAGLLLVVSLALGEKLAPASLAGWGACLALALVHVSGQGTLAWALGRLPAATASVVVLIQPAVTAVLGWMLFGETIGAVQGLGALAVLGGAAVAQWAAARAPQPAQ